MYALARKITTVLVLVAGLHPVYAVTVFDNGIPTVPTSLYYSDPTCGVCGGGPQLLAEDFSFASDTLVSAMTFYGGYAPNNTPGEDLTITFFENSTNQPGPVIVSFSLGATVTRVNTADNNVPIGIDEYVLIADFAPTPFAGGQVFWVPAVNDGSPSNDWFRATTDSPGNGPISGDAFSFDALPGSTWRNGPGGSLASQISSPVPEPTTLLLLGLGLAGLAFARRQLH